MKIRSATRAAVAACRGSSAVVRSLPFLALSIPGLILAPAGNQACAQGETTTVTTPAGATHGSLVANDLPKATGPNTVADSGIAANNVARLGANTFTGLQSLLSGVVLPSTTNPTGSNLYVDSNGALHFVNSHDWTLVGSCFLADCSHPYILVPFTAGATYTAAFGKSPLGCLRQEFYNGGSGDNFCTNSIYVQGDGVTVTTTAPFAAGATILTVTANVNIANGAAVSGPGIAAGTTVSSYSSGTLQLSQGLTVGVPAGVSISVLVGSTGISPANAGHAVQATLNQYTNQSISTHDSTAVDGFASKFFPSDTITTGANFNAQDFTGRESSVAGSTQGAEIDVGAGGPDDVQARFGIDLVGYESAPSGDGPTTIDSLIRFRPPSAEAHATPNPTTIVKGGYCATMPGGAARGVYGAFQHCILADGGESVGAFDAISGTLTANPSANASSAQPNLQFPLSTNINVGQIVSGSANIPAGTSVIAAYQCDATNQLAGCGSVTNAELVVLSANLTGVVSTAATLTFTGSFNDGSNFNGIFSDAFVNWINQLKGGVIKAGTLLNTNSTAALDICAQGEDSNGTEICYSDTKTTIITNTHGSAVGVVNIVATGGGQVQADGVQVADVSSPQTFTNKNISGSEITSGTVASARGGAGTVSGALRADGSGDVSQAAAADLSNGTTGSGAVVLATSPTIATPTITGDLTTQKHTISNGTALTSGNVAFGAGAGTSPTLNSISGDDRHFNINFTTGASPSASSVIATITFANSYGALPQCVMSAAGANSASTGMTRVYVTSTTTTVVLNGVSATLGAATLYTFNVQCIQ